MSKSEKILKSISGLIENGILNSQDIKKEITTDLKFKKDKIINKLELVSREEFEVLKKIVQKQDIIIPPAESHMLDVITMNTTISSRRRWVLPRANGPLGI